MTLQDEEAVGQAEASAENASAEAAAPQATKERISIVYDDAAGSITLTTAEASTSYTTTGLPENVVRRLSLIGLARAVQQSKDPDALIKRMRAGEMPGRVAPGPKALDPWREAYALAKVEMSKKTDSPILIERAKELAAELPRGKLVEIKTHPLVVKHYAKITGASVDLI